jgi:predicted AAA+ superfamily ATPase
LADSSIGNQPLGFAMTDTLHPRYIAPIVREALSDTPVVCLLGPRQSGKTTLAKSLDPGAVTCTESRSG